MLVILVKFGNLLPILVILVIFCQVLSSFVKLCQVLSLSVTFGHLQVLMGTFRYLQVLFLSLALYNISCEAHSWDKNHSGHPSGKPSTTPKPTHSTDLLNHYTFTENRIITVSMVLNPAPEAGFNCVGLELNATGGKHNVLNPTIVVRKVQYNFSECQLNIYNGLI